MSVVQIRKGYEGWLQRNYKDLKTLEAQHRGDIVVTASKNKGNYRITIRGKGRFRNHKLELACYWPIPATPPTFQLLNTTELAQANHPHIRDIYWCLKAPWTPKKPLSAVVRDILKVWWTPKY